jgi:hypothetical protein
MLRAESSLKEFQVFSFKLQDPELNTENSDKLGSCRAPDD